MISVIQLRTLRQRLGLGPGTDVQGTIQRVTAGASLTPENLWLLVGSAILASIGLDLGSAAVIIGAMLISPLMGPILGVGLGVGITDRDLLERSLRELAIATIVTVAVSAGYFLLSPLASPTTEMVARTRPTLLDVGVAFFGGVAGIVAGSRKQQSLALPGVAIATALMPPLCTAGFGLATGHWTFFLGAFYLYLLNAIFIALSTFLVVRMLHFPHHEEATVEARLRERRLVAVVALVATLPSVYFLYDAVRGVREQRRITDFVQHEVEAPGRAAPQWEHRHTGGEDTLRIFIAGHPIDSTGIASLQRALPRYGLEETELELVQSDVSAADLQRFQGNVQREILGAIATTSAARDSALKLRRREEETRVSTAARELAIAFPEVVRVTYAPRLDLLSPDSLASPPIFLLSFASGTPRGTRRAILMRSQALLRTRLGQADLSVVER